MTGPAALPLLLVDDNADQADLVRRALERHRPPFAVTVVGDGFACLDALAGGQYAAVLLDYSLPRLNGIQVLERIRSGGNAVPVVMVTGQGDERVAVEALKGGATDYVLKTSGYLATLPTVVQNALRQSALAAENERLAEETRSRLRDTEALLDMARSLNSTLEFDALLQNVAQAAARTCRMDRCAIYLWEEDQVVPVMRQFADGRAQAPGDNLAPAQIEAWPVVAEALRSREPVVVDGLLVLPLVAQGRALGVLVLDNPEHPGPVDASQVALGRAAASQVALSLENGRLYRDAQQALADLKAAQEKLVRGETLRALGELASGAAHHLNNLLAVIHGRTQLLLLDEPPEPVRRPVQIIQRAASDGAEVVRRIQQFARMKQSDDREPMNLNDMVADVVEMTKVRWRDAARAQGIAIELVHEPGRLPVIAGHPAALREVLTNLVLNAVDAMPEGGRITIRTWAEEAGVAVEVKDTGIGMSPETLRRAQEPFFTTKGVKSTGLGLSVNYGIIKRHGGEMAIDSAAGRGTTVTVRLPSDVKSVASVPAARPPKPAAALRVLVIDDEPEVLEMLGALLVRAGHHVTQAPGPREGLAKLATATFDVVLTDLGMPGMTGWEVAREVKARCPGVAVGLITGWSADPPADEGGDQVDFILGKPVNVAELQGALARVRAAGLGTEAVLCHSRQP